MEKINELYRQIEESRKLQEKLERRWWLNIFYGIDIKTIVENEEKT